jgi:CheY-like chemotaxis protein
MSVERGRAHVMVVEDDRDTREVVKLILELDGMGVSEAADGLDALQQLHKLREEDPTCPCAIVLDIMMPRCSGLEFRRLQLEDPVVADVPIVVLSAVADQMPMEELKAFARMSKPFDPEQLVRTVRRACEFNGHGMSGAPTPSKPSTPSNPSKPSQQ